MTACLLLCQAPDELLGLGIKKQTTIFAEWVNFCSVYHKDQLKSHLWTDITVYKK